MSEEEIIKEIEIIKETQDIMQHNLDIYPPKEDIYKLDTKQLKAVICLLDLYQKEKEKNKKVIEMLQEHIKHCEQEAKGSLNNEICHIALNFDKHLLQELLEERN